MHALGVHDGGTRERVGSLVEGKEAARIATRAALQNQRMLTGREHLAPRAAWAAAEGCILTVEVGDER